MFLKDKYYKQGWDDALYEVLSYIHNDDNIDDVDSVEWLITETLLKQKDEDDLVNEEFDCVDQIDIENVRRIEEDELH